MFEIEYFDLKDVNVLPYDMFLKDFKPCAMFNNDIKNVIMLPLSFTPFKKKIEN